MSSCPICHKPSAPEFCPFCSKRCKQVDLNRWLSGVYLVPGEPVTEENSSVAPADDEAPPSS